jgi:hypothetical protein
MHPVARTIKVVSKPFSAAIAQDVLFISYLNKFRRIRWPSSGELYKLFKEAIIPTTDLLCFSTSLIMYVNCRQLLSVSLYYILNILNYFVKIFKC